MRGRQLRRPPPPLLLEVVLARTQSIFPDAGGLDDQAADFVDMYLVALAAWADIAKESQG